MRLHADRRGSGPRVVLVHGFTQTRRCWGPVVDGLTSDHEVVLVDAPGHGRSSDMAADLVAGAEALADTCGPATYLGYSMGARLCLHVALHRPDVVRGLVLLGGTAGIEDPGARAARRERDQALAARLREIGLAAFLDEWLSQPLFDSLPRERACVEERRENTVDGLASSLELAGAGSQESLWPELHRVAVPVLALAGELDAKFAELAQRMAGAIGGDAQVRLVPGAGHTAHLERPDAFLEVVRAWLARHGL